MELINQIPEDAKQDIQYPILISIFNQSFLDKHKKKTVRFFLMFTLFYSILFSLYIMFKPLVYSLMHSVDSSLCNPNLYSFIVNTFLFVITFTIFIIFETTLPVTLFALPLKQLFELFYKWRKEPPYLQKQLKTSCFYKTILKLSSFSNYDQYLFTLRLTGYIANSDIKSIQYMLDNSKNYQKDLKKLEEIFKNESLFNVHLVSEEIAKITEKREQDKKVTTWIEKIYNNNSSVLNKQNEQFQEILTLHNSSLEPNDDLFNFQIISTHNDVEKNIMDYLDNQKTNKNIIVYKDIKKIFEEQIIQKNNNLLKELLDKVLN
jgi:hypothetical protein